MRRNHLPTLRYGQSGSTEENTTYTEEYTKKQQEVIDELLSSTTIVTVPMRFFFLRTNMRKDSKNKAYVTQNTLSALLSY